MDQDILRCQKCYTKRAECVMMEDGYPLFLCSWCSLYMKYFGYRLKDLEGAKERLDNLEKEEKKRW